jgi:hypothetical protein
MNKRLIRLIGGTIFLLIMIFIMIVVYDRHLHKQEDLRLPSRISSYSDAGYYKIDPETILTSLGDGDEDVFMPLLVDPQNITEDVTDITISWTETDFLKIADALGHFVWDTTMGPKEWKVYYIAFRGSCNDSIGFNFAKITYFKTGGRTYVTRLIEIDPYLGLVRWGNGETYPKPILQKWNSVDLFGAKFTADDALRITSNDAKERFQLTDNCGVLMSTPQNNDNENWYVRFIGTPDFVTYIVNLDTGHFSFQKANQ